MESQMVGVWLGQLLHLPSWSPSCKMDSGFWISSFRMTSVIVLLRLLSPVPSRSPCLRFFLSFLREEIIRNISKEIPVALLWTCFIYQFVFKCNFQGLLWPPLARDCWSLQSWSRWGRSHLLIHEPAYPWIRSVTATMLHQTVVINGG